MELLKRRFGENHLHYCDIMLKDIQDSHRINRHVKTELSKDVDEKEKKEKKGDGDSEDEISPKEQEKQKNLKEVILQGVKGVKWFKLWVTTRKPACYCNNKKYQYNRIKCCFRHGL